MIDRPPPRGSADGRVRRAQVAVLALVLLFSLVGGLPRTEQAGAGPTDLLLVTSDGTASGRNADLSALFTTFGWVVTAIDDDASATALNAAADASAVVYVTAGSNFSVTAELATSRTPVVSEDSSGWAELMRSPGLLQGTAGPFTALDVVDATHPITSPLGAGLATVFSSGQTWATWTGSLGTGMETLATVPSATDPVLITAESGADLVSGTAENRRVFFGIESAPLSSWNSTLEAMVERALDWAAAGTPASGTAGPPIGDLVMVTANGGYAGGVDASKRNLFESFGWTVTALDDDATPAEVTAAATTNDVMFMSDTVNGTEAYDVRDEAIGIVNEDFSGWSGFLNAAAQDQSFTTGTAINVVDNTHPITAASSLGSLTIHTATSDISYWDSGVTALPAGVDVLAEAPASSNFDALLAADAGATLYSSYTAVDRRVWFPSDFSDPDLWTSDYETLLQRSLLWAASFSTETRTDSDSDGLWDEQEDANTDADDDPATSPGPNTDGDANPNYLDADDDGDGTSTASENADPNGDGDPRDAIDSDQDGEPDYLDVEAGPSSLPIASEQKISDSGGGLTASLDASDNFGFGVASLGDVDDDGVADLLVSAAKDNDGATDAGAAYVLFLNANGTVRAEQKISASAGGFSGPLDTSDQFGSSAAALGDVDGDGVPDAAVGVWLDDDGATDAGAVYVLFLNSDGTVRAEQKISASSGGLTGPLDAGDKFGSSVSGLGDVDGDGTPDLAVGALNDDDGGSLRGAAYVLLLNPDGTVRAEQKISDFAGGLAASLDNNDQFGRSVAGLGDVDGDGTPDLAVGAYEDDDGGTDRGATYVLFLNTDGSVRAEQKISETSGGFAGYLADGDELGVDLAGIGDIDGNGTPDLAVSAFRDDADGFERGAVYLLSLESDGTVASVQEISSTAGGLAGPLDNSDWFGTSLTSLGDLDRDGALDLAVGTRQDDDGASNAGAVYVLGLSASSCFTDADSDGLWDCEEDANADLDGDPATNADPDTDGDTTANYLDADDDGDGTPTASENADPNGDGDPRDAIDSDFDGQPDYLDSLTNPSDGTVATVQKISDTDGTFGGALDNGDAFGRQTVPIGDLDGDGIVDLAAGVPGDDDGGSGRGAVYILFMNADGTVSSEQKISDTAGNFSATLDDGDSFGESVGPIGDLDGDGRIEVAVAANRDGDGGANSGAVYILFLETNGTVASHAKVSSLTPGVTLGSGTYFGESVIGPGDVNGDGIPDLAVGALFDSDGGSRRGAVHVFFLDETGSVTGQQKISETVGDLVTTLENGDEFGSAVGSLGDLDGDGTPDIIVGARGEDDGGSGTGAAYVLFLDPDGTVKAEHKISATSGDLTGEPGAGTWFGRSVAGVGDIDGDGNTDALVGAPFDGTGGSNTGAAHLLFLQSDGTVRDHLRYDSTTSGLTGQLESGDEFGTGVGALGDLDRDGTLGLIMTARYDDDGGSTRGAVYVIDLQRTTPPNVVLVNSTGDTADATPGDGACTTGGMNSEGDAACTLRAAIQEANASATVDTIEFAIPTSDAAYAAGPPTGWTITPAAALPALTAPVVLDATTQPTFTGNPIVALDGSTAGGTGLQIEGGASSLRGLAMHDFVDGIVLTAAGGNTVAGNWIGLLLDGTTSAPMTDDGISIEPTSPGNTIGGSVAADRNIVAGASSTASSDIEGIDIQSDGNVVEGNYVGTDATGLLDRGHRDEGIDIRNALNNVIRNNVIAYSSGSGIQLIAASGTTITGNRIGVAADGVTPAPNAAEGLYTVSSASSGVTIGGTSTAEANMIAHNGGDGIRLRNAFDTVSILGNGVFSNGGLGIDLGSGDPNLNDAEDTDGGTNRGLNYPVLGLGFGGATTLDLELDLPAGDYRIELFANPTGGADPSGFGEGETLMYAETLTVVGAAGAESFTLAGLPPLGSADVLTATATEDLGGGAFGPTSEFSAAVDVVPAAIVNSTADGADATPGDAVCDTGGTNSEGAAECTLRAAIEESNASATIDTIAFAIPNSDPNHRYYQNDSVTDSLGTPVATTLDDASITDFDPDYPLAPFSWWSIEPAADLPYVTSATTIDGTTQPGWQPNTAIDGSPVDMVLPIRVVNPGFETLALTGGGATVKGLQLSSSNGSATMLGLYGTGGHTAEGLWLMTDPTGSANAPGDFGIYETAGGNQIGGPDPSDLVLVGDGFGGTGVDIGGNGNTVQNLWIGVSVLGNETLGAYNDISLSVSGDDNVIGTPGAGVIVATSLNGQLYLTGDRNTVHGSRFGILADGTLAPDNRRDQVVIRGVDNMFGGVNPGEGNIVVDGTNQYATLMIDAGSGHSVLGSLLLDLDGEQLYLDISPPAGPNTNDGGDLDSGVNGLLNHPVITSITDLGSNLDVDFELDVPAGDYRIEFFGNDVTGAPGTGYGAGDFFIGAAAITHAGAGAQTYSTTLSDAGDHYLAATATQDLGGGDYGSTSEFGPTLCTGDSDGDGLCDDEEDRNTDGDGDPSTNPGPNTDGDANPNYLDADDDGDGTPTANENADPNDDGDPRDALDSDFDGEPDYLDAGASVAHPVPVADLVIGEGQGGFAGTLDPSDYFGQSLTPIGDLDGDGIVDMAVGAPYDGDGGGARGAVYVLFLNADGSVKSQQKISDTQGGLTTTLDDSDFFGIGLDAIGDLDGDGNADLIVGANGDDDGGSARGAVYVLFLNADGTVKSEQKISDTDGGLSASFANSDSFGQFVGGAGDVDGDGVPDVVVGAPGGDDAYVLLLNTDGTVKGETLITTGSGGLTADVSSELFGYAVTGVGDLDGDGVRDIVVGAPADDDGASNAGAVYVLFLNADGTVRAEQKISNTSGDLELTLDSFANLGTTAEPLGDLYGRGTSVVAFGLPYANGGGSSRGVVFLFELSSAGTVLSTAEISNAVSGLSTLPDFGEFGWGLGSLGDLDGDGSVELAVGAAEDGTFAYEGRVFVIDLCARVDSDGDGLWDCEEDANTDADGDPLTNPGPNTDGDGNLNYLDADDDGDGTPTASENADPNGDGDPRDALDSDNDGEPDYLDLPAGSSGPVVASVQKISQTAGGFSGPLADGDTFGDSVTAIGDLDGDGVVDVVVAADQDDTGGTNNGAVWVLLLNADGTVKNGQKIASGTGGLAHSFASNERFGSGIADVGDLDGDGRNELAVGAVGDLGGGGGSFTGAVHVLFLNVNGTVRDETRIASGAGGFTATIDDDDNFGSGVAGIGDIDGDGIPDMAVGANGDDDGGSARGAVYVLFMNGDGTVRAEQKISQTSGGLSATIGDTDLFGVEVEGIGDVDGNGVPDLAVGATGDDEGAVSAGAVYVLLLDTDGTLVGDHVINASSGDLRNPPDDSFELMGGGIAGVGDLDGDGVPEIAVGASEDESGGIDHGSVRLLYLRPDGSVKREAAIGEASAVLGAALPADTSFGAGVAAIGDLDGDGPVGLLVGADNDDDGGSNRGAVYVLDLSADPCGLDTDSDGLWDCEEDADSDFDGDPTTNPGPNTDGDANPNYLDADDDGDGIPTASENADPNSDGDPRDAIDSDVDGQPDWLDPTAGSTSGGVIDVSKVSDLSGGLAAALDDSDAFGSDLAAIGDLDGDGVIDLAVGLPGDDDGANGAGAVLILFMNADGSVKAERKISSAIGGGPTLTSFADFGEAVDSIGDLDGDGVVDLVVGAPGRAAYVLFMNIDGTARSTVELAPGTNGLAAQPLAGRFGFSVSGVGDLDGDGIPDIAVGDDRSDRGGFDQGAVYVLFLNADGTVKAEQEISDIAGGLNHDFGGNDEEFGGAITTLGDLDGDGVTDLAVGAVRTRNGSGDQVGGVHVLLMNADGTVKGEQLITNGAAGLPLVFDSSEWFGASLAGLGDIDGDGRPDLVVGAEYAYSSGNGAGAVVIMTLNVDGSVKAARRIDSTHVPLGSELQDNDWFGSGVASLGDTDGDGLTDIAVGAASDDDGGNGRGAFYVLELCRDSDGDGLCDEFEALQGNTDGDLFPNEDDPDDDGDGIPTASENADPNGDGDPRDARDADVDGEPDYLDAPTAATFGPVTEERKISSTTGSLVGPLDDGDAFGSGVTPIGDLDGDGVVDVVVGASTDDDGGTNRGAAYVLFLNVDGSVRAEQKISDTAGGLAATLDDSDYFGEWVGNAGDLDGDGRSELLVSARSDDDGGPDRGSVYVLFLNVDGSVRAEQKISDTAGGLAASLDDFDRFGASVDGAGDLDGDGIPDVVVGADGDDDGGPDRGSVYVLFLNVDGSVRAEQKISDTAGGLVESLDDSDYFGEAVAGIGDVDGDGTPDVVAGAWADDDGAADAGAVFVLFLNPDGTVRAEQKISATAGGLTTGLEASDWFGGGVGAVGDLDSDGVPDLLVGAPGDDDGGANRGTVYVLLLNANGTVKTEQKISDLSGGLVTALGNGDWFGIAVSGIGDLDDDGIIDIAAGALYDDDGGADRANRGAVYLLDLSPPARVVNSTGGSGDAAPGDGVCDTGAANALGADECTLRAAIEEANASGQSRITFDIPVADSGHTSGVWTVALATELPDIAVPTTIDASTQPGWTDTPVIELDGSAVAGNGLHVVSTADGSTIRSLAIGNIDVGVRITGAAAVTLAANHIGADAAGTTAALITADGVVIESGATDTAVGGSAPSDGNLFGSIGNEGLLIEDEPTDGAIVQNNSFGVSWDGAIAFSIGGDGIVVSAGADPAMISDNVIGNTGDEGIDLNDGVAGTLVQRNTLGTDAARLVDHFIDGDAIRVDGAASDVLIGGDGAGNHVAVGDDHRPIIIVDDPGADDVAILGNTTDSEHLVIDLGENGPLANDPGDADSGANDLLNHPTLARTAATPGSPWSFDFDVTLDAPAGTYRIEIFAGSAPGYAGAGRAEEIVHTLSFVHGGTGAETVSTSFTHTQDAYFATTATEDLGGGSYGSSSELSSVGLDNVTVSVNSTGDVGDADVTDGVCDTGGTNSEGATECTFRAALEQLNRTTDGTIEFSIPTGEAGYDTSGYWTIPQTFDWEDVWGIGLTVDGSTQAGFDGNRPVIHLQDDGGGGDALDVRADDVTLRALALTQPGDDGVQVRGDRATLDQLWLGVTPEGTVVESPTAGREGIIVYDGVVDAIVDETVVTGFDSALVSGSGTVDVTVTGAHIYGNRNGGVVFDDAGRMTLLGNSIHDNVGLGFELGDDGVPLPNDVGDGDSGGNDLLNKPIITSTTLGVGTVDVDYSIDVPAGTYRIEFFDSDRPDPTGFGEGQTFLSAESIVHPGGSANYTATVTGDSGDVITATATPDLGGGSFGGTSEFSNTAEIGIVFVNSTGDSGDLTTADGVCDTGALTADGVAECTLRAAIEQANAAADLDRIHFQLTSSDPGLVTGGSFDRWLIAPTSALPTMNDVSVLDASTQPLWSGTPLVQLDGLSAGAGVDGLPGLGQVDVAGLSVTGWQGSGVTVGGFTVTLRSNWFGLTPAGAVAANAVSDVVAYGSALDITVGGADDLEGNVFAAAGSGAGLMVTNSTSAVVIEQNHFGVAADGVTSLASASGELLLVVDDASDVTIRNNQFGAAPNAAVVVAGSADQVDITGNLFGTDANRSASLPVGQALYATTSGNVRFGGAAPDEGNTVLAQFDAIVVTSAATGDVSILGNSISGSGALGIDLDDDGPTSNDTLDGDTGANDLLNFPEIVTAEAQFGAVVVAFDLDVPAGDYRIEAFANPSGSDPTGFGEGEVFVGAVSITHAGGGAQRFEMSISAEAGDAVTMTATQDLGGGVHGATSEFSFATASSIAATVEDLSSRRTDLTLTGGADAAPSTGIAADGLSLDGSFERLVGPATDITSTALTLSTWVRQDAATADPRLISKGAGAGVVYESFIDTSTSEAVARLALGGVVREVRGGSISIGSWHHVAATWDSSVLRLFVDGNQVDSLLVSGSLATDLDAPLIIGNTSTGTAGLDGSLDQVEIQHRAWPAAEVAARFRNGAAPSSYVSIGAEQLGSPDAWVTSSVQARSGTSALMAPETFGTDAWVTAVGLDEPGTEVVAWWWVSDPTALEAAVGARTGAAPTDQFEAAAGPGGLDLAVLSGSVRSVADSSSTVLGSGSWQRVVLTTDELGTTSFSLDGVVELGPSTLAGLPSGSVGFRAADIDPTEQWFVDDVRVRRLVSDEPTATLGPLERN